MASEYNPTTDFLKSHAQAAMTHANNAESRISSLAKPNLRAPRFDFTVNKPVVEPPPAFGDMFGDDTSQATIQWLNGLVDNWLDEFFPNITQCLKTLPDQWLCDVISGVKPLGYSQTYFDLAWHASRDRAQRTRRGEVAALDATFSNRGFSLPPGAYVALVDEAHQRASDVTLEVNREQTMKDIEIKHQMLLFAVEQGLQYKLGVWQLVADLYRQWASVPNQDIERARIRASALASFTAALSSYYQVEVAFEQLRMRAAENKAGTDVDVDRTQVTMFGADSSANAALGTASAGFSDISAAAANAAGTLVTQIEAV